jgi:anaerobic glycerol-3-phosphate dehydrogenase
VWRERSDFIIGAEIEPGATGKDTEQLWARKIDESHFDLCCIPFLPPGAWGVRTEPQGDRQYPQLDHPVGPFLVYLTKFS